MARTRLPRIAATAASVGIVALAWFVGASPQLDAARLAQSDQTTVDAANDALRERLVTLREQHARIDAIRSEVGAVRQQVPAAPALPDLVDQITAIAAANGVEVTSYRAEESLAPLATAAGVTAPSARLTADNLFAVPVTLNLRGSAADTLAAVHQLQMGTRLFLVTSARVVAEEDDAAPGEEDGSGETSELRGYVYVLTEG